MIGRVLNKLTSPHLNKQDKAKINAVLQVYARALASIRDVLSLHSYAEVANGTLFIVSGVMKNPFSTLPIEFEGANKYLLKSSVLQLESLTLELEKRCFTVGKSFEAITLNENDESVRSFGEVTILELECPYDTIDASVAYDKLLALAEELIKYTIRELIETNHADLFVLGNDLRYLSNLLKDSFYRISYEDALHLLSMEQRKTRAFGDVLTPTDDELILKYFHNTPTFITESPGAQRLFNTKRDKENKKAYCIDLIVPGYGRPLWGGLQEENSALVKERLLASNVAAQMQSLGLNPLGPLKKYFELRQNAAEISRGGISIEFEKLLGFIIDTKDTARTKPTTSIAPKLEEVAEASERVWS